MQDVILNDQRQSYASKKVKLRRKWQNYVSFHKSRSGALGRIRTPDPLIRSQVLYPTELPARGVGAM